MSLGISKKYLERQYVKFKYLGRRYLMNNDIRKAIQCLTYSSYIAYLFPFRKKFCDESLEHQLDMISQKLLPLQTIQPKPNRYVFFDSHFIQNAGLTQQYLRFLFSIDAEILLVLPDRKLLTNGSDIIGEIQKYQQAEIYINDDKDVLTKIKNIHKKISDYSPTYAFFHFIPFETAGYIIFKSLPWIKRYYINLTDHTYWIGKGCSDYFLEFRSYGYNLSMAFRDIPEEKLRINPYYPVTDNDTFEGFDFEYKGKVVGFLGANLYKLYADTEFRFLKVILHLLKANSNFIFVIAGFGDAGPLYQFIRNHHLENRMYFIGKRKDFNAVMHEIDIYFNSYPICGALTTLYAVVNRKAIIGLTDSKLFSINDLKDLLNNENVKMVSSFPDFIEEADQLIKYVDYRKMNIERCKGTVPTPELFNQNTSAILYGKRPNYKIFPFIFDFDFYLDLYLNFERKIDRRFYFVKFRFLKSKFIRIDFCDFIKTISLMLILNRKIVFNFIKKRIQNVFN